MYEVTIEKEVSRADLEYVEAGITAYNLERYTEERPSLIVMLRGDGGRVFGGLVGRINWEWLQIRSLWVADELRGQGFGSKLMQVAELEAIRQGCKAAHLSTFGFQAPEFYKKLGYEVFGMLPDYPAPHNRYFLRKPLT